MAQRLVAALGAYFRRSAASHQWRKHRGGSAAASASAAYIKLIMAAAASASAYRRNGAHQRLAARKRGVSLHQHLWRRRIGGASYRRRIIMKRAALGGIARGARRIGISARRHRGIFGAHGNNGGISSMAASASLRSSLHRSSSMASAAIKSGAGGIWRRPQRSAAYRRPRLSHVGARRSAWRLNVSASLGGGARRSSSAAAHRPRGIAHRRLAALIIASAAYRRRWRSRRRLARHRSRRHRRISARHHRRKLGSLGGIISIASAQRRK